MIQNKAEGVLKAAKSTLLSHRNSTCQQKNLKLLETQVRLIVEYSSLFFQKEGCCQAPPVNLNKTMQGKLLIYFHLINVGLFQIKRDDAKLISVIFFSSN